ncbi:DUF465 domain-containing protein [Pseudomonas sp. SIMBA_077]
MPVKHDLSQDLGFAKKDDLAKLEENDPHLTGLITRYTAVDNEVLQAEAHNALGVTDEALLKLKEKRLKLKDEIASRVSKRISD